jgi:hypothetical protein
MEELRMPAPAFQDWIKAIAHVAKSGESVEEFITAKGKQLDDALRGTNLTRPEKAKVLEELSKAEAIYRALKARGYNIPVPMKYQSQLIVLIDDDLVDSARDLQTKRETAGDVAGDTCKSHILYLFENPRRFDPPPTPPATAPTLGSNSRVYVLGHGTPDSATIGRSDRKMDAAKLAGILKAIFKWCDVANVKRVNLIMCFGAGNPTGADLGGHEIGVTHSFAHKLFEKLEGAADEVVGHTAEARTARVAIPVPGEEKHFVGVRKVTGYNDDVIYKGHNRKIIFYQEGGKTQHRSAR